jgi:hypothetical protein
MRYSSMKNKRHGRLARSNYEANHLAAAAARFVIGPANFRRRQCFGQD